MRIRVEYFGDTIDEYPIEASIQLMAQLLEQFWENLNVKSVTFIREQAIK